MRWVYRNPIRGTAIDGECSMNMDDDDDQCSRLYMYIHDNTIAIRQRLHFKLLL